MDDEIIDAAYEAGFARVDADTVKCRWDELARFAELIQGPRPCCRQYHQCAKQCSLKGKYWGLREAIQVIEARLAELQPEGMR